MKFTIDWLQKYVETDVSADRLADKLTMLGLEVDAVTPLFAELQQVKVAKILSAKPHPNADKLQVCQVAVGEEELEIVCGAPNARTGLVTAVAPVGTTLPGNFKIKKSKVRGIISNGMLCSEKELGFSDESDGIMELPENLEHGMLLKDALELDDTMIEVDLTPNRADCASMIGIAREVAGFTGAPLKLPVEKPAITKESSEFSVEIRNPELCNRYSARLIKNIKIGPSPFWLRKRLLSIGLRPINNVVDITNFVMMEYGQPLHAFDFKNVSDGKIIVRTPQPGEEKFVTLDSKERVLTPDTLMICDGKHPVAVGGVMGGMNSEVEHTTTTVLLESACFNPISIRKTARSLNISTDASYRFERGVDPEITLHALNRASNLLCELAGGTCDMNEGVDVYPEKWQQTTISLSVKRCNTLNGINLSADEMSEMLASIDLKNNIVDKDTIKVFPPSFRMDIEREADLVEEIARLYGYDNIPVTLPEAALSYPDQDFARLLRLQAMELLTNIGYTEAINYSFTTPDHLDMLGLGKDDPRRIQVSLLNPLNEDQAVMRTSLLPGLLENVRRNISFQSTDIKIFEMGKIFVPRQDRELPLEQMHLAGVISGNSNGKNHPLYFKSQRADFYDIKGCLEYLFEALRLNIPFYKNKVTFEVSTQTEPFSQKNQALSLFFENNCIGSLGKIAEDVVKGFGIKQDVYYFDLDFDTLCTVSAQPKSFISLPTYPAVTRDIALIVAESVSAGEILTSVRESKEKLIEHSDIFDIFSGDKIPDGYKSVALTITYRSPNKTLTEKHVEKAHSKIVSMLTKKFGGHFREA